MDPSLDINRALKSISSWIAERLEAFPWSPTTHLASWMLHGDLLRIEHAGGTSWRLLLSSQGHAPDDDDDDDDDKL